jgi:protein disulfide-isomerase
LNNLTTLKTLALEVGLDKEEIEDVLNSELYKDEVLNDQLEAEAIGINGVPFFIFDYKYAVSGAQPVDTFLRTIQKTWDEGNFETKVEIINTMVYDNQKKYG